MYKFELDHKQCDRDPKSLYTIFGNFATLEIEKSKDLYTTWYEFCIKYQAELWKVINKFVSKKTAFCFKSRR